MAHNDFFQRYPLAITALRYALSELRLKAGLDEMGDDGLVPVKGSIAAQTDEDVRFAADQGKILLKLPVPNGDEFLSNNSFYHIGTYTDLMRRLVVEVLNDSFPSTIARTRAGIGDVWFLTGPDGKVPANEEERNALYGLSHEDMARCQLYLVIDAHQRLEEFMNFAEHECTERQIDPEETGHSVFDEWVRGGDLDEQFKNLDAGLSASSSIQDDGHEGGVPELA